VGLTEGHPLLRAEKKMVIGHRGNAMFAPENTLVSVAQGVESGADAIEIDVHLSADGEVVVIHDATLDRTTSGSGAVAHKTLAQLRQLDAGARFTNDRGGTYPWRDQDIRIPTLPELLNTFPHVPFVIEIKAAGAQQRVLDIVREFDAAGPVAL
jgi:glycerophosphoryl diester phosphodiesterase